MNSEWLQRGNLWVLAVNQIVVNFLRFADGQYVDYRRRPCGPDLEQAKRAVEHWQELHQKRHHLRVPP